MRTIRPPHPPPTLAAASDPQSRLLVVGRQVLTSNEAGAIVTRKKTRKEGRIALCRDEVGRLAVVVDIDDTKEGTELPYSTRGGVALHGKFIPEGKATVRLVGQRVQIMLSRGDPTLLGAFMRTFVQKLEGDRGRAFPVARPRGDAITAPHRIPRAVRVAVRGKYRKPLQLTQVSPAAADDPSPKLTKRNRERELELSPTKRTGIVGGSRLARSHGDRC